MAGVCFALYAVLVLRRRWIAVSAAFEPRSWRVSYFLIVHAVAFVSVALLASHLSERVRVQTRELDQHQGAVQRLQALNENIIESIHSGLITTDLEGRVNFMNRGGAEITGRAQDDVEGTPIEQVFGLEAGFLANGARRSSRRAGDFGSSGTTWRRTAIAIFLGIAVSILQDRADQPLGYIFTFQDLTEVFARRAADAPARSAWSALGQMAAGMAHELRQPALAAISGSVQYLKGDLKPGGETLELMDIILRESQRLDQAIRDFLTFARPGSSRPSAATS